MSSFRRLVSCAALLALSACASKREPQLELQEASYADLPGWEIQDLSGALAAFQSSCQGQRHANSVTAKQFHASALQWQRLCATALAWPFDRPAKDFFETHFSPSRAVMDDGTNGFFTGYYVPLLNGSMVADARFRWPVYGVPADRVNGTPYFSRAEIDAGALRGKGLEILWVDDPVMLFFMQIQGSGFAQLPDGRIVLLQYAAQNGHGYVAIGKVLAERGEIPREHLSLQSIRQWLYDHPDQAFAMMAENPSYIFFKRVDSDSMPKGAQGVVLTPEASLAIDSSQVAYGLPVYVSTAAKLADGSKRPYARLLIAQDRGGAIKGVLRGDIFFGRGVQAEAFAGEQKERGDVFWLLPNGR